MLEPHRQRLDRATPAVPDRTAPAMPAGSRGVVARAPPPSALPAAPPPTPPGSETPRSPLSASTTTPWTVPSPPLAPSAPARPVPPRTRMPASSPPHVDVANDQAPSPHPPAPVPTDGGEQPSAGHLMLRARRSTAPWLSTPQRRSPERRTAAWPQWRITLHYPSTALLLRPQPAKAGFVSYRPSF